MARAPNELHLPFAASVAAAVRLTQLDCAQDLQNYLTSYDVPFGSWCYWGASWEEDGISQRKLSRRVGAIEPTTAQQLSNVERGGLIAHRRSRQARRQIHIRRTPSGNALKARRLPYSVEVNAAALDGLTPRQIETLRGLRTNLEGRQRAQSRHPQDQHHYLRHACARPSTQHLRRGSTCHPCSI